MKKRLNIDQIQSELRGGSAFFPGYKGGDSPTASSQEAEKTTSEDNTTKQNEPAPKNDNLDGVPPSVPRPVPRTVPRPVPLIPKVKRPIRQRQPFDVYEDQYQSLKKISNLERGFVNGRGMSQMVREAIDDYLKNHSSSNK
jgi:hypothetical protein